ncbi:hypothetical protein HMPREF1624_02226 [Sporothrix schenckii ATCC 58251]|uniref:Helicase ATP-binding domain-containing protein n=1 Tax=Sporothrix schenckii (strain ATCC 58251 / de Perez 2211183) TaxID=1391915 RepID=U7Q1X6_SPOS1|nr:hypothetical protein HMPREF1624_02226 [Sporothrix schenckii ATCC 58251]
MVDVPESEGLLFGNDRKDDHGDQDDQDEDDNSSDNDEDSDDDEDDMLDKAELEAYFNGLENGIIGQGLKHGIHPFPHQVEAAAAMLSARKSKFKGLILADPPGLGKTLSSLMAIAASDRTGRGPCVVVVPTSCCSQWVAEARRFLSNAVRVILVTTEDVSPVEVYSHDLVVTSYSHLAAEISRRRRFERDMKEFTRRPRGCEPKVPHLSLFSGFYKPKSNPWDMPAPETPFSS